MDNSVILKHAYVGVHKVKKTLFLSHGMEFLMKYLPLR